MSHPGAADRTGSSTNARRPITSLLVYTPSHFAVDAESASAFLAGIRAADLVTVTEEGLVATFLPLLFDPTRGVKGALRGHVARKNDQWKRDPIAEALVIVHAEDAYITPSWYPSKAEHGRVVPTWNYRTAHVFGQLVIHDDAAWVDQNVRQLTELHEAERAAPWSVDDAPPKFRAGQLRAIVGVEVLISRVEAKFKMSQNRREADIDGVVAGLSADGLTSVSQTVDRLRRTA
jgi:transcriptional regulator